MTGERCYPYSQSSSNLDEPISSNQKDIALMYAIGITIDDIADIKGIKPITVRNHLDVVRNKLGVKILPNRTFHDAPRLQHHIFFISSAVFTAISLPPGTYPADNSDTVRKYDRHWLRIPRVLW